MSTITRRLNKFHSRFFVCNYAPGYKTFITHRWEEKQDPLHEYHKRLARERKREGLWWHVTIGVTLSKSSAVRTWVRRRLQNAFLEEMRERGIERDGRLVKYDPEKITGHRIEPRILEQLGKVSLTGSIKLHAFPEAITAKYEDIRMETGKIVDTLLQGLKDDLKIPNGRDVSKSRTPRPTRNIRTRPKYLRLDT